MIHSYYFKGQVVLLCVFPIPLSEGAEKKGFGEDRSHQHGRVNMALGCINRSRFSLQHLLSAGIYYPLQKPTQSDWTFTTSCLPYSPSILLPPRFYTQALAAGATGWANFLICISVLVSVLHCHPVRYVSNVRALRHEFSSVLSFLGECQQGTSLLYSV